jgi:hypothetical protein
MADRQQNDHLTTGRTCRTPEFNLRFDYDDSQGKDYDLFVLAI